MPPSSIYLDNKYTKIYYKLIQRAQERTKPLGYTEKHHIIPKCKPFCGPNTKNNLVYLTFKEHWVCHHLLMKMFTGKLKGKMYYAFSRMGSTNNNMERIINSKMFERVKITNRNLISGKNSPLYGIKRGPQSEEHKRKRSEATKGIPTGPRSEEIKKKISEKQKGIPRPLHSKETKEKQSISHQRCTWKITYPDKKICIVPNLRKFCRENNLCFTGMIYVSQGKYTHHHGFKCQKIS